MLECVGVDCGFGLGVGFCTREDFVFALPGDKFGRHDEDWMGKRKMKLVALVEDLKKLKKWIRIFLQAIRCLGKTVRWR